MNDIPKIGNIYAIKMPNGIYGACRLIESDVGNRFIIVDCFFKKFPTLAQIASFKDMQSTTVLPWEVEEEKWWFQQSIPKSFLLVGNLPRPTDRQHCRRPEGTVLQSPNDFVNYLYEKWRQRFEQKALAAEWRRKTAKEMKRQDRIARERKKKLTLSMMAGEKPFGHWTDMWPRRVITRVRKIFSDATRELISLQATKDRAAKIRVLTTIIDELNKLEEVEECIETTEREEVFERIEELASLVGISNKGEKLTGHRDW
jgi:hypothetical protein